MISRSSRIVRIFLMALLIGIGLYFKTFYNFNFTRTSARNVNIALSITIILLILKLIIDLGSLWFQVSKKYSTNEQRENIIVGLSNLFSIIAVVIVILGILSMFGLNPSEVFTSLSIVAAAIAVIAKEFITEISIGVMNGFSNKIDINDYISIGNTKGKVLDLGLQKVTLLNDDGEIIYIPNIKFHNEELVNYTKKGIKQMGIDFQMPKNKIKSIEELEFSLSKLIYGFEIIEEDSHELKVKSILEDNVNFRFDYKVKYISQSSQIQIKKVLMRHILNYSMNP